MKKGLLGFYDYTVILTYCGMFSALYGILRVLNDDFPGGIIFLMLAGVCDMFDGVVASTRERTPQEKCFGIQIDSLSDLISFGVLPGLFVYRILEQGFLTGIVVTVYVLCALIRLAYFNVLEEERQKQTTERRSSYLGVPVTTIAILLPATYLLYDYGVLRWGMVFIVLLLALGVGFLLPVKIRKPHALGKIGILFLGIAEMAGLLFLMGGKML